MLPTGFTVITDGLKLDFLLGIVSILCRMLGGKTGTGLMESLKWEVTTVLDVSALISIEFCSTHSFGTPSYNPVSGFFLILTPLVN